MLGGDLLGHLHREAVGIPEPEHDLSGQGLGPGEGVREYRVAVLEGLLEPLLLHPYDRSNELVVVRELGVYSSHALHEYVTDLAQEGAVESQAATVPHGPPDHPSQDIASKRRMAGMNRSVS